MTLPTKTFEASQIEAAYKKAFPVSAFCSQVPWFVVTGMMVGLIVMALGFNLLPNPAFIIVVPLGFLILMGSLTLTLSLVHARLQDTIKLFTSPYKIELTASGNYAISNAGPTTETILGSIPSPPTTHVFTKDQLFALIKELEPKPPVSKPLEEHSMVCLIEPLVTATDFLPAGHKGTIISVHNNGAGYTVEFSLGENYHPVIVTLDANQIKPA